MRSWHNIAVYVLSLNKFISLLIDILSVSLVTEKTCYLQNN